MSSTAQNIDKASGNNNSNPVIPGTGSQNLFSYIHDNPDAKVILNRGSIFENDITDWVMSFSTSNSVDDIIGSFNVVLNNKDDRFVDRYGNVKIAEASAIEIFAKTSIKSNYGIDNSPATNSDTIIVTEKLLGTSAPAGSIAQNTVAVSSLINDVIRQQYGDIDSTNKTYYELAIRNLNATRVISTETISDAKSDAMFGDKVSATDPEGNLITEAYNASIDEIISAADFFKGTTGQNIFFATDLVIAPDPVTPGKFLENQNKTYQFTQQLGEDNKNYPIIRPELVAAFSKNSAQNTNSTVYKPVLKSQQVPFLKNADGSNADRVGLKSGDILRVPPIRTDYRRIFFGVVINIAQNISPGANLTISLNGKSLGYWLEASVINIKPAVDQSIGSVGGSDLTFFANKYANHTALDIFRDLISFSTDDLVAVSDYSIDTNAEGIDVLNTIGASNTINGLDNNVAKGVDVKPLTYSSDPMERLKQLEQNQKDVYNGKEFPVSSGGKLQSKTDLNYQNWLKSSKDYRDATADITKFQKQSDDQDIIITNLKGSNNSNTPTAQILSAKSSQKTADDQLEKAIQAQTKALNEMNNNTVVQAQTAAIQQNINQANQQLTTQLKAGRDILFDEAGITKHWQRIFSQLILEVLDGQANGSTGNNISKGFLSNVHPLKWETSAPGWLDGDYQSKADIGRMIAQSIMYEFYFDTNGHFVLKPPLYSISNQNNNADYILTDSDIYSININDTLEGIITRIDVTGSFYESPSTVRGMIYNTYQDFNLIKNYGLQSRQINNLSFIRNNADCRAFGRAFMSKNNMELKNATVTIYGRPEIRLGTSIYLQPRDTVYYIKGISHDFTTGDGMTTTLTLAGARRIIRGFKASKAIKQFYKIQKPDGTFKIDTKDPNNSSSTDSTQIEYFVPLNATNFSNIPLSSQSTMNDQLNAQLNVDNPGLYQPKISVDNAVILLSSVYVITRHPTPAMSGLIVSKDSAVLKQINTNYYNLLNDLKKYANNGLSPNGKNTLSPKETSLITPAAKTISDAFQVYVKNINAENFTYENLNTFLVNQYKQIQTKVESDIATTDNEAYLQLDVQRQILDLLLGDIDAYGSYSQYTDEYGREFPAYIDFGKSMTIFQSDLALDSLKEQNDNANNAKKAAVKALGSSAPALISKPTVSANLGGFNIPTYSPIVEASSIAAADVSKLTGITLPQIPYRK